MPLREQDTAIWVGDDEVYPVGSSGKVYEVDGKRVLVGWGDGLDTWCRVGSEVITPRQAANRGVEPWVSAFAKDRTPKKPRGAVDIFNPGR